MNELFKRFSPALRVILLLLGGGVIVGALVFGDDRGDLVDHFTEKRDQTQPMEVRGDWLGMSLVDLTSRSARRANFPPTLKGVMVTEISESIGWRARQAGVMSGDVISAVNRQKVRDINEFYDVTRKVDTFDAVYLDVNRWSQVVTLVMAAVNRPVVPGAPMAAGAPQQPAQLQPQAGWGNPQGQVQQPQAWTSPQPPQQAAWASTPAMQPVAWGSPPAPQTQQQGGPLWVCRRHGLAWQQQAVQPSFRCPLCNEPLRLAQ